jgi:hypothetical protein
MLPHLLRLATLSATPTAAAAGTAVLTPHPVGAAAVARLAPARRWSALPPRQLFPGRGSGPTSLVPGAAARQQQTDGGRGLAVAAQLRDSARLSSSRSAAASAMVSSRGIGREGRGPAVRQHSRDRSPLLAHRVERAGLELPYHVDLAAFGRLSSTPRKASRAASARAERKVQSGATAEKEPLLLSCGTSSSHAAVPPHSRKARAATKTRARLARSPPRSAPPFLSFTRISGRVSSVEAR